MNFLRKVLASPLSGNRNLPLLFEVFEFFSVGKYEGNEGYKINILDGTKFAGEEHELEYQSYLNEANDIDFTFLPAQDNIPYFDLDICHVDWVFDALVSIGGWNDLSSTSYL